MFGGCFKLFLVYGSGGWNSTVPSANGLLRLGGGFMLWSGLLGHLARVLGFGFLV